MTKNVIRKVVFDAKEPNNPDKYRKSNGNNRWSVSNIRQWLNSSGAANSWFTPKHEYDASPTYASEPGFLAGFSADVLQHFTEITNTTALTAPDGGGSETTIDRVFLPSYTEMGLPTAPGTPSYTEMGLPTGEGSHLSIRYPDDNSRIKSGADNNYWTRTPVDKNNVTYSVYYINNTGNRSAGLYYSPTLYADSNYGIAPIIVLH